MLELSIGGVYLQFNPHTTSFLNPVLEEISYLRSYKSGFPKRKVIMYKFSWFWIVVDHPNPKPYPELVGIVPRKKLFLINFNL